MISIVDASDLQYVLRPTVYRPVGERAEAVILMRDAASGGPAFAPEAVILMRAQRAEDLLFAPTEPRSRARQRLRADAFREAVYGRGACAYH